MKITPPFADYELAYLERLVQDGFEQIERNAYEILQNHCTWGSPSYAPMSLFEFQVLMAADKYVKQKKEQP